MKKIANYLVRLSALALALGAANFAMASDGEVLFSGNISAPTCKVDVGGSNLVVTLPTVSVQTLNAPGKTAGRTPFNISLSGCEASMDMVAIFFEPGKNTSQSDNRLINSLNPNGNVQLQLLNKDMTVIKLGNDKNGQGAQSVPVVQGRANLEYFVEYYATGNASAGAVSSSTEFLVVYP